MVLSLFTYFKGTIDQINEKKNMSFRKKSRSRQKQRFNKSSIKGWSSRKPQNRSERKRLLKKGGRKCFLEPNELKFPVCNQWGNYDCGGIHAAKTRARGKKHSKARSRAESLWKKGKCAKSRSQKKRVRQKKHSRRQNRKH